MMRFALIVSSLFEPMLVVYVLALIGGWHAGLSEIMLQLYVGSVTLFVGLVIGLRLYFKRKDKTNWDISNRKKRFTPLLLLTLLFAFAYYGIRSVGNTVLTSLFLLLLFWHLGFFLLTLKVKLSGHMGILTLAIGQCIAWFGVNMIPLILIIPLLAWSRVTLKRHTIQEVIIGVLYSGVILLLPTL
ncbi:hypothetical protein KBC80_02095 [Candidatus Woesebacteria bacterium]|nr:hypothetical protein [Candidatus Woesebacteria bacterium]